MSKHQEIMDHAYHAWGHHQEWSQEEFLDQLNAVERFAVHTGNLNYQVENGGWAQWADNGYASDETVAYLRRQLLKGGPASVNVLHIMERALPMLKELDNAAGDEDVSDIYAQLDPLCSEYYAINEAFMGEVEQRILDWK